MRSIFLTAALAALIATPAMADSITNCAASWKSMSAADQSKTTYKAYSSTCLKADYKVPAASAPATVAPAGATGVCKDGAYTMAKNHQGACSSHGGVSKWLN